MAFVWQFLDDRGEDAGRSRPFGSLEDAEAWVGTAWQDLLERGVEAVALVDLAGGERVYRMGLRPA